MKTSYPVLSKTVFALVFAAFVGLGWGDGGADEPAVVRTNAKGASDVERLVERLRAETSRDPESAASWRALCDAYLDLLIENEDLNLIDSAQSAIHNALRIDSTSTETWRRLAKVRYEQRQYDEAIKIAGYLIKERATDAQAWGLLGDVYMDVGKYRSADSSYFVMFEMEQDAETYIRIARAEFELRSYEDAIGYFDKAIQSASESEDPGAEADAYTGLAIILLAHGEWDPALRYVERTLAIRPDALRALALKAEVLFYQGRSDAAFEVARRLTELSSNPRYKVDLARITARRGDAKAAEVLVRSALRQYEVLKQKLPDRVAPGWVALLLEWNIDPETAFQAAYRQSRRRRDVYTYDLLAWAYYKNGKYDLAWSCISLALRKNTKHPQLYYHAAMIAKAGGLKDKFETFSRRALDLNPHAEQMYAELKRGQFARDD